jgi:hypothetical protein
VRWLGRPSRKRPTHKQPFPNKLLALVQVRHFAAFFEQSLNFGIFLFKKEYSRISGVVGDSDARAT